MFYSRRSGRTASPTLLFIATLIWLLTACGGQPEPTPVPVAIEPPTISEPKISAPTPQEPGQEIGISVDVSSASGVSLTYEWQADGGDIVRGDGSPAITYRTPAEPGIYNVRVTVKWDTSSVEKVTTIRVEAPEPDTPTPEPPTDTPTPEPDEPSPTATVPPPTSTLEPTATLVPATATTVPTNTPRPTPIPTATIDADPTVYDNFNNPAFDGEFHKGLWDIDNGSLTQIRQQNGAIELSSTEYSTALSFKKRKNLTGEQLEFFEAKILLSSEASDGNVGIKIFSTLQNGDSWLAQCIIEGKDTIPPEVQCGDTLIPSDGGDGEDYYEIVTTNLDTWHIVRLEINSQTGQLSYYIDGQLKGSHIPSIANDLQASRIMPVIDVWAGDNGPVKGLIDDVKINPVE